MSDRLATIGMGRKWGGAAVDWVPTGSPSNTMWPGPRPTSLPSGILDGELGLRLTQCGQGRGLYLHAKFHIDSSTRLATVHERYRQTDRQTRQRTDGIGRIVLQTVAQK